MLVILAIIVGGGGCGSLFHPRVRHAVYVGIVRFGDAYARVRFPEMYVDWEDVRYQKWLKSHAAE